MHFDEMSGVSIHVELKPCPFCGGKAFAYQVESHTHLLAKFMPDHSGSGFVECSCCTAGISGESKQDAINAWNNRIPQKIGKRIPIKHVRNLRDALHNGRFIDMGDEEWNTAIWLIEDEIKRRRKQ